MSTKAILFLTFIAELALETKAIEKHPRRNKRYLIFPEGSSLQMIFEGTYPSVGMGNVFVFGNTIAMAYELPSTPAFLNYHKYGGGDAELSNGTAETNQQQHSGNNIDYGSVEYLDGGWQEPQSGQYYYTPSGETHRQQFARYGRPVINYHHVYRRSRRELYSKVEKLFTAMKKDGRSCILKTICHLNRMPRERKGSLLEEIFKAIFRVKPNDDDRYSDEDHFDEAANPDDDCERIYSTKCAGAITFP